MSSFARPIPLIMLLLCISLLSPAQGVVFQRKTARSTEMPPKALLIKINSQQSRLAYAARTGNTRLADIIRKDAAEATRKMIMDFTDNFYYCPVYYFYDTSAANILAGNFAGVLLDKDLKPAANSVLQPGDTNFFVGYYGVMAPDFAIAMTEEDRHFNDMDPSDFMRHRYGHKEEEHYRHRADMNLSEPWWIVVDHNFRNLRAPIPWSYYWAVRADGHSMKQKANKYRYSSKRLNIVYRPSALKYAATLDRFYGPYPYHN